jgi:uncharacterized repeat protein (TIGR01451 family)
MKSREKEQDRRDSLLLILLILLVGFVCIIFASGRALRFAPNWSLPANMESNLDLDSEFQTSRPIGVFQPLDPAILTNPAWIDIFLTPGATLPTRQVVPTLPPTGTPVPPATITSTSSPAPTFTPTIPIFFTLTPIRATNTSQPSTAIPTSTRTPTPTNTGVPLPSTDLRITKTDGSATYTPGAAISYTIVVSNAGPANAIGASVTDAIPAAITGTTINCVPSGTASCGTNASAGNSLSFTGVNIPTGAANFLTITVNGTVNPAATGNLVNMATVFVGAGQTDPVPANNSATDTNTSNPQTNLGITKTDGSATYIAGNPIVYTITVSNAGPSHATGVSVTDAIPVAITGTTINCVASGTASCGTNASAGNNLSFTGVNIPAGAGNFLTITVNGTVNSAATGNLVNTALVIVGAGQTDPVSTNNSAIDINLPNAQTDLGITKTDGSATYVAGNPIAYTIVVSNTGPSDAIGASVTDPIPAAITGTTINCVASGTASCGTNASAGNNLSFTGVNIPVGAGNFLTITASGTVSPATTGNLVNTATVTAGAGQTDPTPANATDTDTPPPVPDLTITKTDIVTQYSQNGILIYAITVTNSGTLDLTNIALDDPLPVQITSWLWSCNRLIALCAPALSNTDFSGTFDLTAGTSIVFTVTANVSGSATGDLVNTATVTAGALIRSATDVDTLDATSEPEIDVPPDGGYISVGTSLVIDLGLPKGFLFNGTEAAYDFVYYERWYLNPSTGIAELQLDCVEVEVSTDATTWYTVFYWCDGGGTAANPNTNVDINVIGGLETDNRSFPPPPLYANPSRPDIPTGITIDVDAPLVTAGAPNGNYRYIRFSQVPEGGADGPQIDSIELFP